MIYFDHNATTPLDESVLQAMLPLLENFYGNPSSLYRAGRVVRSAIETAREQVAALVNVAPSQIIFTSGGTEANNFALKGLLPLSKVTISAIEHASILEPAWALKKQGIQVEELGVDEQGIAIAEVLENQVKKGVDLVSIMLANNETGVIQDIESIAQSLHGKQVILHTDAIQALGKIPVDFKQLGVNLMSLSSHKIYGPKGCGALVFEQGVNLKPMLLGGGHENGLRAGTENVAAIIGFGHAAQIARETLSQKQKKLLNLRKILESELKTISGLIIFSEQQYRLPNTVQFGLPGIDGEMLLMQLDRKGIAVSSGSACSSEAGAPSHVLMAMGVDMALAKSAIRVSLGCHNTEAEVNSFVQTLKSLVLAP